MHVRRLVRACGVALCDVLGILGAGGARNASSLRVCPANHYGQTVELVTSAAGDVRCAHSMLFAGGCEPK
jgi:hypothetical protein